MRVREHLNHARRLAAILAFCTGLCSLGSSPAQSTVPAQLDSLYTQALESSEPDELRQAISAMVAALPKAADRAEIHRRIGELYLALGKADDAVEHLETALAADSTDVAGHYLLARAFQGLGKTSRARREADAAIHYDPTFAPGYLLLAQTHEKADNLQAALAYYKRYLEQRPGKQTPAYEFTLKLLKQGRHKDVEELSFRMADVRGLPLYAQALLKNNDYEGSLDIFRRYIKTRPSDIQNLYEDISLVGLKREARAYQSTTSGNNREAFLRRFWLGKDPFKTSGGAMRRAEHYRRVWHALTFFGETKKPWDRRGDVYIRYGEPDYKSSSDRPNPSVPLEVQRVQELMAHQLYGDRGIEVSFAGPVFPIQTIRGPDGDGVAMDERSNTLGLVGWRPVTTTSDWSAVPWEVWIYADIGNGTEFAFTDDYNSGSYDFAPLPAPKAGEEPPEDLLRFVQRMTRFAPAVRFSSLSATTPERYSLAHLEPLDFYYETLTFRGKDGKTDLQVNIGLPVANVALKSDPDTVVVVERRVSLIGGPASDTVTLKNRIAVPVVGGSTLGGQLATERVDLQASPGRYELALQASRIGSDLTGVYRQPTFALPDYSGPGLLMSDIQIAKRIGDAADTADSTFVRGALDIRPWPPRSFYPTEPLYVYFEIYNLTRDEFGATRYEVSYEVQAAAETDRSILTALLPRIRRRSGEVIEVRYEQIGAEPTVIDFVQLELSQAQPGRYTLQMNVTDQVSGTSTSRTNIFRIAKPPER